MMPMIHDLVWWGSLALFALLAWKTVGWLRLPMSRLDVTRSDLGRLDLRRRLGFDGAAVAGVWTPPRPRSSGNAAFDDWRDGELARLEAERQTLEAKLHAFEGFVDKLRRAKDRVTFDRFMAEQHELTQAAANPTVSVGERQPD